MKKYLMYLILIFSFIFPSYTFAHVLITDGDIGAVLHIDPDDDPIAGEQASFFFELKDKTGKFKPENCKCTFTISKEGKEIFNQVLFQDNTDPNLNNASVFFTFTERNIYQLKLHGEPIRDGLFKPFTLTHDLRVSRTTNSQQKNNTSSANNWLSNHVPHLIGAFLVLGFFIYALLKQKRDNLPKS